MYNSILLLHNSELVFLKWVHRWLLMKPMLLDSLGKMPVDLVMTSMCLWCVELERTSVGRRQLLSSLWKESRESPAWSPHFLLMLVSSKANPVSVLSVASSRFIKSALEYISDACLVSQRCVWLPNNGCQRGDCICCAHYLSPWRHVVSELW